MDKERIINLLHLKKTPVYEQLLIEESLLRTNNQNWCLINEGSLPSIVMGISGKPHELINTKKIEHSPLPVIKRYSGGGTVIVDEETLFVSFIFEKEILSIPCYPEPLMKWSADFYKNALPIPEFQLKENDYTINHKKCGGNAQYITKNRFVHHTTFLWDYENEKMDYLLQPKRIPTYREDRPHSDFLCRLKDFLPTKKTFISSIVKELSKIYSIKEVELPSITALLSTPHRISTTYALVSSLLRME